MFRLAAFAAGLSLALPLAAAAQPVSGPYVGGGAGINLWDQSTTRGFRIRDEDLGFVGLGSLGWGFGNGLRVEAEGNYRESEIDRITGPAGRVGSSGYLRNYGVMGNVLFDFDLSSFGIRPDGFMPYIGGGAGYVWTDIKNARLNIGGSGYRLDDSDGNLAYQAILGAAWGLGGVVPGLSLTGEVRYFGTLQPNPEPGSHRRPGAGRRARLAEARQQQPLRPARPPLRAVRAAARPPPAAVAAAAPPPRPPPCAATWCSSTGTAPI